MDEFLPQRSTTWVKTGVVVVMALAVVFALAGAAAYLAERVKQLRETTTQQQRQIASLEQRLGRLELQMEKQLVPQLPPGGGAGSVRQDGDAGRKERPGRSEQAVTLTRPEIDIVREYIKIPPSAAGASPTLSLGMPLANQPLIPLPSQLVEKLPKLAGGRFKADRDGSIVIVGGGSDRVDLIIPPN